MLTNNLPLVLFLWMAVVVIMALVRRRKGATGVGLVLAYVLNTWMLFWAGSASYVLPWFRGDLREFTVLGAEYSLYAIAAFAFGSVALTPLVLDLGILPRVRELQEPDPRLPLAYLVTGGVAYGLLSVFMGRILSMSAILSSGQELVVVGLGLCAWHAWCRQEFGKLAFWLAMSLMPPLVTVVTRGFLGYGAVATISILIFLSSFVQAKIKVFAAGVLLGYLALSVFVTYMRDRPQIRSSVWGQKSYSNRLSVLDQTAGNFEWFNPWNEDHLERIDSRLNQAFLVGAAVEHLGETGDYANGQTLYDSLLALIPRILWPGKTVSAGSGTLVARFTGFQFDNSSTSVGIGQIMEFYANFGTPGLVIGFMVFGVIITTLDVLATERLAAGDLHGFVLWYLPGLAFLDVGGQLVEITASAAASVVVALIVNRFLDRLQRGREVGEELLFEAPAMPRHF